MKKEKVNRIAEVEKRIEFLRFKKSGKELLCTMFEDENADPLISMGRFSFGGGTNPMDTTVYWIPPKLTEDDFDDDLKGSEEILFQSEHGEFYMILSNARADLVRSLFGAIRTCNGAWYAEELATMIYEACTRVVIKQIEASDCQ